jgi:hypothetical protein
MIHNFLDIAKIIDNDNNIYSIAPSQHFYPLGLFIDKHSKELIFFQHYFTVNVDNF